MSRADGRAIDTRRWERRPDDRPRLLMASALKLLKRDGYRRVRLEDVAKDAGVCKATVYHYFSSKDDLLSRSIATRMAEKQVDMERRLASAGGTAAQRLRLFLGDFWTNSLTARDGFWQRLVLTEMVTEAPEVFSAWARGLVRRWKLVETLIKEGQDRGEFRRDADAAVIARTVVSGLSHQALFHVHFGLRRFAPCDPDRLFASTMQQLLHGLRPALRRARLR